MREELSAEQSLQLIQSMISKAKDNLQENRFYFLMWGWIAFAGIMGQFILKVVVHYRHHYLPWLLVIVGVIATIWNVNRQQKKQQVRTYIGESMGHLWLGMGISFFVLSFIISFKGGPETGWLFSYPFFILFYALGTFVSGKLLQFRPLIWGGISNWLLACASVFFSFDYQMLFAAAAILFSYLIPGYALPSKPETTWKTEH